MPRALAIIPARLSSSRLARKMLLEAGGLPLFAHTVRNAQSSGAFARVVLATDSDEILERARSLGIEALPTRVEHASGTERIHEAWQALRRAGEQAEVVVNVQGDEPELDPRDLAALVAAFGDARVRAATLAAPLSDPAQAASPHVVKVVADRNGDALYFSRAAIPADGHPRTENAPRPDKTIHRRHVGVYAFAPAALEQFCALPRGEHEMRENLEQLRWLEAGEKMRVVPATRAPEGIDTQADFERFVERLRLRTGPSWLERGKQEA
ncbi:MAG: 3-deoxy-manno-octulosonate cytidylyltransferase [Planctomycetes bacterium]|nr:3-deoxy-manno-octulosonate cytidylyltransferase [Planctomycetota bacterium]